KLEHLEINQNLSAGERISRSREIIRNKVLSNGYDAWFSWECDQIVPAHTLGELIKVIKSENFTMVSYNSWGKDMNGRSNTAFSCALILRKPLEKYSFLLEEGRKTDPDAPNSWHGGERWFRERLVKAGGSFIDVDINKSIEHLPSELKNAKPLRLNLGCGDKHRKGYINIDIQGPCDLRHDFRTPWPFVDVSVDEIFTEGNFPCLFSPIEWRGVKREMARVLKTSGKLEIIFLDFEYILKAFLNDKEQRDWWWMTIFSAQDNQWGFSKNGFTYEKLTADLSEEGMADFERMQPEEPYYIHLICYKQS
ncbi:MAG: hypothetical protein Q7S32_03360, partial [bacterium]|nr:hypothetical protein [bacterium]